MSTMYFVAIFSSFVSYLLNLIGWNVHEHFRAQYQVKAVLRVEVLNGDVVSITPSGLTSLCSLYLSQSDIESGVVGRGKCIPEQRCQPPATAANVQD